MQMKDTGMISQMMRKMIMNPKVSMYDINHFLKVHAYAKMIGELEGVDSDKLAVLEAAAVIHDIACPDLREKYGTANGKEQEITGRPLAEKFLADTALSAEQAARVVYLVAHHHTLDQIDDVDYQILIEADYLVNADEVPYSKENIINTYNNVFKTESGKELLQRIFLN